MDTGPRLSPFLRPATWVGLGLALGATACNGASTAAEQAGAKSVAASPEADEPEPKDDENANFADPQLAPPSAPAGTVALPDPWIYVQTCGEAHPCESLKQPAGDAHCRRLRMGGYENWRLPSKQELEGFAGAEGLEQLAGYHWSRTPYKDDINQVWIVDPADPSGAPATTIPRDRKPFRIRCVKEP